MRRLAVSFVWVCSLLLLCVGSAQTGEEVVVICPFSVDRLDYYRLLYNPVEFYNRHSRRVITVPHQLARTASPEECAPEQQSTCAGCKDLQLTRYECFHVLREPRRRSDCGDNWCIVAEVHVKYCPGRPGGDRCRVSHVNRREYERQCGNLPPPARRHTVRYYRRHGEGWCAVDSRARASEHATVPSPQDVFIRMRQQDEQLLRFGYLEFEMVAETRHDGNRDRPFGDHYHDQMTVKYVQLIYTADRLAAVVELRNLCFANPDRIAFYKQPDEQGKRRTRSLSRRTFMVRNEQVHADYSEYYFYAFDSSGCISESQQDLPEVALYSAYSDGLLPFYMEIGILCLGRGYTFGIRQVRSLTRRSDGLWELRAWGTFPVFPQLARVDPEEPELREGEWRLIVDPETLIVREAYWDDRPISRTVGVLRCGSVSVAAVGNYYEMQEMLRQTVVLRRIESRFDEALYRSCLERVNNPPKGTLIRDRRSRNTVILQLSED